MTKAGKLNLMMIGDDQRYAEHIVHLLSHYYDEVNLSFLDAKNELIKLLRQRWDVLIFGDAYDMSFTDVVGIVQEHNIDLPLVCLMNKDTVATGRNEDDLPATIDANMIKAIVSEDEAQVVIAIRVLHEGLKARREMAKLEHIIAESEQRANILIKNSKSAVAYIDEGIHIFANEPYIKLFGFDSMEDLLGVPVIDLIAGGENVKAFKQFLRRFDKGGRDKVEFNFESRRKDGSTFEATLQLATATFEGDPVTQVIIQQNNAVNSEEIAKKLAAAERRDSMTGLLNRRGFEYRFDEVYPQIKAGEFTASLVYVIIDGIGKINSNLGIQGVDAVIKQVSHALDEKFDVGDLSRFGDSNFMVLLTDMNKAEVLRQIEEARNQVANMLIEVGERTVTTTLTFGMVMIDSASPKFEVLVNRASEAARQAYAESENIGNVVGVYDASLHAHEDDAVLSEYIQTALNKNLFKLLYQPIYDIETDRSDFFEAYLRLPLSDGTLMTPDQFMPIARSHDLVDTIDRWLLINACKQLNEVRKTIPDAKLLVRLSSGSLANKKLATLVGQLVKAIGGNDQSLCIQFQEQDIVDYLAVAKKQSQLIKEADCCFGVSNFGSTAKTFDVITLVQPTMARLSKSYVKDLADSDNMQTVTTLIEKATQHSVPIMMPYIEDAAAMSASWSVGARYLQGDYLQEPAERMVVVSEEAS